MAGWSRWRKLRVLGLLLALLGVTVWWSLIRIDEQRVIPWSVGHPVMVCPLVLHETDFYGLKHENRICPCHTWSQDKAEISTP